MKNGMARPLGGAGLVLALACALPCAAQQRVDGVVQQRGFLGQPVAPDEFLLVHESEFKGAGRVAISAFNVAFPNENHFTATSQGRLLFGGMRSSAKASMSTTITGVDPATRQRIADRAYALFVDQLRAAGYEVVDQAELTRLAPEYATWAAVPNFSEGRFGAYVAPTGMALRFLQGDTAKRDTSGMFGTQTMAFRALDNPPAFSRSPYIAHDGNLGIVAVTLVVDYGVYSSSGEKRSFGAGASAAFKAGVTIAAGNALDHGTFVMYWGPKSGGFPAYAHLQLPIRSELQFLDGVDDNAPVDSALIADAPRFEVAANEVVDLAVPKLVGAMAASR